MLNRRQLFNFLPASLLPLFGLEGQVEGYPKEEVLKRKIILDEHHYIIEKMGVGECRRWYKDDVLHRVGGPAIESDHRKEWWVNGKCHRTDGPAVEHSGGRKEWWVNGELHRTDGPAVTYPHGEEWYQKNKLHRTDGPAIYLKGKPVSNNIYHQPACFKGLECAYIENGPKGVQVWFQNGKLHREDGPSVICELHKSWHQNGKLHREDGPAIEYADGAKSWYQNGKLHREDGPAVECANGDKEWYWNGNKGVNRIHLESPKHA